MYSHESWSLSPQTGASRWYNIVLRHSANENHDGIFTRKLSHPKGQGAPSSMAVQKKNPPAGSSSSSAPANKKNKNKKSTPGDEEDDLLAD